MSRPVFDLLTATQTERDVFYLGRQLGYLDGRTEGWAEGWAACDQEIAALQREAVRRVRAATDTPPRDRGRDRARRERIDALYARKQAS